MGSTGRAKKSRGLESSDALVAIGGSVADGEFMNSSKLVLWLELVSNEGAV